MGIEQFDQRLFYIDFTVEVGNSESGPINLYGLVPCGVRCPGAIDSATALTFAASTDVDGGGDFDNVYRAGAEYSLAIGVDRFVVFDPSDLAGCAHLVVRLGTSGTPVTATADRVFRLAVRRV